MATITLKGNPIKTYADLPNIGSKAPNFELTKSDLSQVTLDNFKGINLILNIFPSLDTPVCAASVRQFNSKAAGLANTKILCISADLPFAHQRFCSSEGIEHLTNLSCFRNSDFGKNYGVLVTTGPLTGLLSRAIVIINPDHEIAYTQQVPEITQEPDYESVLHHIKS